MARDKQVQAVRMAERAQAGMEQAAERALAGVETYVENQVSRAVAEATVRVQPHLCVATEQVCLRQPSAISDGWDDRRMR